MRILLISTNRHDRFVGSHPVRPIPLGLAILLGVLRETRHEVHVLDLMFERAPREAIHRAIRKTSPDLIGMSVRNLDAVGGGRVPRSSGVRSFLPEVRAWIRTCRQTSRAPIIVGGPAVSLLPREAFAALQPDFLLAGDASRSFPALAERLAGGKPWNDLPGLTYRHGTAIQVNPLGPWESPAVPPHYDAFDLKKYQAAGYSVSVLTKLWPYLRTAGPTPMTAMPGPVARPVPDLLADLRDLRTRLRIRRVFLADSGFNVPLPEAKTLCRALHESGVRLEWATGMQP
ncbi:MAG TPA: cobalamin-dependent protein, partial [Candidatus Methylomirabilis sp.]|nr:cobalamin-dependent protein [Candidatus Methylomirabilis sp.]